MADGCEKRRFLDDEMSRFEAEILGSPPGSSEDPSERQTTSSDDRSDDRPRSSSKAQVETSAPLPPPPRPPLLNRSAGPLRPPPPPPNLGAGPPHLHGSNSRPQDQMSAGPRPLFNGHRPFGPGPMGLPRPNGPHHRPFHSNGGPPDSYGSNGPRPFSSGSPQQYSNGRGPYRPMRPDGPYGPDRLSDFNMQGDGGAYMNRDPSGGPMRGPGSSIGPPPPPTFLPPQLLRPSAMRPPPPPPPVHLMRASLTSSNSASLTTASLLPTLPPPPAPRIVYASQPTLFTEIVKPAEPAPTPAPPAPVAETPKSKDTTSNKESGRKNKKQKTSHGSSLVQQVTTTVSIVKKSGPVPKQPSEAPVTHPPVQQPPQGPRLKKERRPKKNLRYAGGTVWEDPTLNEWDPDDYRMFAGDLGNDVTDELLTRTFNCYPSFVKAKVVRDKFTNKSKGYGFLSFREPDDYTRAMKEMNGRYVGSRPIKLRKSQWRDRNLDVIQKKNAEKQLLGLK